MNCRTARDRLLDAVDGNPSPEIEGHLAACAECRALHDSALASAEMLRGAPRLEPPADGWTRLSDRLDAARKPAKFPWLRTAAAAALVLGFGVTMLLSLADERPPVRHLQIEIIDAMDRIPAGDAMNILDSHAANSPADSMSPDSLVRIYDERNP